MRECPKCTYEKRIHGHQIPAAPGFDMALPEFRAESLLGANLVVIQGDSGISMPLQAQQPLMPGQYSAGAPDAPHAPERT